MSETTSVSDSFSIDDFPQYVSVWSTCIHPEGRIYYFDSANNKAQWEKPTEFQESCDFTSSENNENLTAETKDEEQVIESSKEITSINEETGATHVQFSVQKSIESEHVLGVEENQSAHKASISHVDGEINDDDSAGEQDVAGVHDIDNKTSINEGACVRFEEIGQKAHTETKIFQNLVDGGKVVDDLRKLVVIDQIVGSLLTSVLQNVLFLGNKVKSPKFVNLLFTVEDARRIEVGDNRFSCDLSLYTDTLDPFDSLGFVYDLGFKVLTPIQLFFSNAGSINPLHCFAWFSGPGPPANLTKDQLGFIVFVWNPGIMIFYFSKLNVCNRRLA